MISNLALFEHNAAAAAKFSPWLIALAPHDNKGVPLVQPCLCVKQ